MPNHVTNKLTLSGSKEAVAAAFSALAGEEGTRIDFNKVIPMPAGMDGDVPFHVQNAAEMALHVPVNSHPLIGGLQQSVREIAKSPLTFSDEDWALCMRYMQNYRDHGHTNGLDWARMMWGTKWNAYDTPDKRDTETTVYFCTAWSTPVPVFKALSGMFLDLTVSVEYADEGIGSNCGRLQFIGGRQVSHEDLSRTGVQARRFAMELVHPNMTKEELAECGLDENFEDMK